MPRPVQNPPNPWAKTHVEWLDEPPNATLQVFEVSRQGLRFGRIQSGAANERGNTHSLLLASPEKVEDFFVEGTNRLRRGALTRARHVMCDSGRKIRAERR